MSGDTIFTGLGPVSISRQASEPLLRVSWPAESRVGEVAVPALRELKAEWRPRRKAWFLAPSFLDAFRSRLMEGQSQTTEER